MTDGENRSRTHALRQRGRRRGPARRSRPAHPTIGASRLRIGKAFADTIKQHGGQILSKPEAKRAQVPRPRNGTLAEIVSKGSFEKARA